MTQAGVVEPTAVDNTEVEDLKELSNSANEYGSDFVHIFYKTLDTKRHELGKYYADDAKITWNGNEIDIKNRQEFQSGLAETIHSIEDFDVHPMLNEFNKSGHYMILITVSGSVRYRGNGIKLFYQSFMLAAFESKWKIVSDNYRFAE